MKTDYKTHWKKNIIPRGDILSIIELYVGYLQSWGSNIPPKY